MRTPLAPFVLALALASSALAQEIDIVGRWRLRSEDGTVGTVDLTRDGPGLRYQRSSRRDLAAAPAVETGHGRITDGWLQLEAETGPGMAALGIGQAPGPGPTTRYKLQAGGLPGLRTEGAQRTRERLDPWLAAHDGNKVDLLIDGEAFPSMRAAIESARAEIELQTFQWADDETGRDFAARLMAKVRQGVKVRVLVDGSSKTVNGLMKKKDITDGLDDVMRRSGIEVVHQHTYLQGTLESVKNVGRKIGDGFRRLFGGTVKPREKRGLWNHDHRKLLIVDRRVAFTGGMNVADEYERVWHDVVARVEGPTAHAFHRLFVDRWNKAPGKHGRADRLAPVANPDGARTDFEPPAGDARAEALGSIPGVDLCLLDMYLRQIDGAREKILIEVAYFLDDRIIAALGRAAARGVRTVVIIPSDEKNDVYLVKEAFAWVHNDVVRSGVELYMYGERLTHAKVACWDGRTATVGSCNLDKVALDHIAEANIVVHDPRFARLLEQRVFEVDLPKSVRCRERPLPWRRKIVSGTLHFFRGLL